ncbi:hypothetical protein HTVC024P_gp01 [Pelagibacter phage HTVC024P]|nr:hypothetical protein HTVC024P_gp01 [Pelagibacter phage HTVC024P]
MLKFTNTETKEVMEFLTIKTNGISLDDLTYILLDYAMIESELQKILKYSYSKLIAKAKDHILYEGLRILDDDIEEKTDFNDFDDAFKTLKRHIQRSSKNGFLGKTKEQVREQQEATKDIKNYFKRGK